MRIFWPVIFLLLHGCASVAPAPAEKLSDLKFLPPHIVSYCRIHDLDGKVLRHSVGKNCVFFNDGGFISETGDALTSYDKFHSVKWKRKFNFIHHRFRKSDLADELLVLESDLKTKDGRNIRSDVLVVMDLDGNILKSVKFDSLMAQFKNFNFKPKAPYETKWMSYVFKNNKPVFENSHVNSFYEFYNVVNGVKQQAGYIVHCLRQKKILVLDNDLKKIVKAIDIDTRSLHDVHQLNAGELIFYQNFYPAAPEWKDSEIAGYNLNTDKFFEIYRSAGGFSSATCSSVQVLGDDRLFIAHSNCGEIPLKTVRPVVEYVDLKNKKPVYFSFDLYRPISSAELTDLSGFLQNNSGL